MFIKDLSVNVTDANKQRIMQTPLHMILNGSAQIMSGPTDQRMFDGLFCSYTIKSPTAGNTREEMFDNLRAGNSEETASLSFKYTGP